MLKTWNIGIGLLAALLFVQGITVAQERTKQSSDAEAIRAIERIENELRELKSELQKRSGYYRPVPFAELGITTSIVPLTGTNDPFDDRPYRLGLRIEKIEARHEAERLSLSVGDIIVKFEESRVESEKQLDDAMNRAIKEKTRFPAMLIVKKNELRVTRLGEP